MLEYSPWQYTLVILGCIVGQLCVCGALMPSRTTGKERAESALRPDFIGSIADLMEASGGDAKSRPVCSSIPS